MESGYKNTVYTLMALALAIAAGSCNEELPYCGNRSPLPPGMVCFDVSSGSARDFSRAADDGSSEDFPPVVLAQDGDTLYIHSSVSAEHERATGRLARENVSRAAQVNNVSDFKDICGNFCVQATYSEGNKKLFIPLSVAEPFAGDVWYIKDRQYCWPEQRRLRFNAMAPADAFKSLTGIDLGDETITFSYTVPVSDSEPRTDGQVQPDIMFASTTCSHSDGTVDDDYVPLDFRHALSAIKFAVRDVTDGEIVDITIKGVAGSGSCTFNPEAVSAPAFTWTDLGAPAEYTQTFNYVTADLWPALPALEDAPVINDEEGMKEKTFMLIPQPIPEDAELILTFRTDGNAKILKGKLRTADIPLWEAGKEYIYTISTSSENWIYVFEVTGCEQKDSPDPDRPEKGPFVDNDDNIILNATVTAGAYYNVTSYRYRKGYPDEKYPVAWTAESSDGQNNGYDKFATFLDEYKDYIPSMTLAPEDWLPKMEFLDEEKKIFGGEGSTDPAKHNVIFKTQYVVSDWKGDWEMRAHAQRGSSKADAVDLSMANGGTSSRNTANCYVVNSGGWYKFPLYYGNSIKDGNVNKDAYHYEKVDTVNVYASLVDFKDYQGRSINDLPGAPVISGADSAFLVWSDAYNIIDFVELDKSVTPNFVVFHVASQDLQQSNSVIAIKDAAGVIMWSWHIWASEYWADYSTLELTDGVVNCEAWAENKGADANVAAVPGGFDVAPRNLGWCDAKNVQYLQRTGKFTFRQKKSGNTDCLKVEQRGKLLEYWIGNNTYYQWGRKDPMPGFLNAESVVKYNFGPMEYECVDSASESIAYSIQKPNRLFGAKAWGSSYNDWLPSGTDYYNLWNNFNNGEGSILKGGYEPGFVNNVQNNSYPTNTPIQTEAFAYSAVKTVYDPSPAGYVVPPVGFFSIFTKGRAYVDYSNAGAADGSTRDNSISLKDGFNGRVEWQKYLEVLDNPIANSPGYDHKNRDRNFFNFWARSKRDGTGEEILLTGTGHRWYRTSDPWQLGGNFNPHYVYLWSNTCSFYKGDRSAFSLAIGQQKNAASGVTEGDIFIITSHFQGRKSMARPVRCVKEYQ